MIKALPAMFCRVISRHGVHQGMPLKPARDKAGNILLNADGSPQMVDKIRPIDNSKRNLANSHLQNTAETVAPCHFTLMGYVAQKLVRCCQLLGIKTPQLIFSLDDLAAESSSESLEAAPESQLDESSEVGSLRLGITFDGQLVVSRNRTARHHGPWAVTKQGARSEGGGKKSRRCRALHSKSIASTWRRTLSARASDAARLR
jgi:hypothetical protein